MMNNSTWVLIWSTIVLGVMGYMGYMLPDESNLRTADTYPSRSSKGVLGPVTKPRPKPLALWKSETFNVSAYCACSKCCGTGSPGITASGLSVSEFGGRFIAAPKRFPFGTAFRIPGYANGDPVPVLDRGGAIKGNKIDCYFESHQAALNFGRQTLVVMYSD